MVLSLFVQGYSIGKESSTRPILYFFSLLLIFAPSVFAGSGLIPLSCPMWRADELLEAGVSADHQSFSGICPLHKDASLIMLFINKPYRPSASDPTRLSLICQL